MTTALIIFGISLALTVLMLWSKSSELSTGRARLRIGSASLDAALVGFFEKAAYRLKHVTISSAKAFVHRVMVRMEKFFIDSFHYVARRFVSAGNVLTGHAIPKNRGSVSFFLKNIEEHKKARLQ